MVFQGQIREAVGNTTIFANGVIIGIVLILGVRANVVSTASSLGMVTRFACEMFTRKLTMIC